MCPQPRTAPRYPDLLAEDRNSGSLINQQEATAEFGAAFTKALVLPRRYLGIGPLAFVSRLARALRTAILPSARQRVLWSQYMDNFTVPGWTHNTSFCLMAPNSAQRLDASSTHSLSGPRCSLNSPQGKSGSINSLRPHRLLCPSSSFGSSSKWSWIDCTGPSANMLLAL